MAFGSYHRPPILVSKIAVNRRQFIARAGLAIGALGVPMLLEACAPAAPAGGSATPSAQGSAARVGSVFPTFVAYPNKPKPDYPSTRDPYLDGYDNFPKNPVKAISGEVGQNSTVTSMTIGLFPPPTPYRHNPAC